MTWRNIIVDGRAYRWKCGPAAAVIQNSTGKRISHPLLMTEELSCCGAVTPESVAAYIRNVTKERSVR